jgi:3-oxoacyl-[acyl-carrier-protein] synthase-3
MNPHPSVNGRAPGAPTLEIAATGHAYPSEVVDNDAFFARARFPVTDDRAALEHETQMKTRYWCKRDENTWTMARQAVRRALAQRPELREEIDVVLVTSGTTMPVLHPPDPDNAGMQDIAPLVIQDLGRADAMGMDLKACYCTGFLRGLQVMDALLANPNYRAGLLVCAEQGSRFSIADTNRSAFCFLSGDAAGAVVLRKRAAGPKTGLVDYLGSTDGEKLDWVGVGTDGMSLVNKGSRVGKVVRDLLVDSAQALLRRNGLGIGDVDWLVPLQTHYGLVQALRAALECPPEKLVWHGDRTGMAGSASIPSCLSEQREAGVIRKGDLILSSAVGAGLNSAGALFYA